jgi:iron complex transport system ATP-binding protein
MEIMTKITKITKELGIATLIVMHDLSMAIRFCDGFLMLKDGFLFARADRGVLDPDSIRKVYEVEVSVCEAYGIPVVVPLPD